MENQSKCCIRQEQDRIIDSSSYTICGREDLIGKQVGLAKHDPLGKGIDASDEKMQLENQENDQACLMSLSKKNVAHASIVHQTTKPNPIRAYLESYCKLSNYQFKADSTTKLKDSTKKLLYLIEEIQSKTYSKDLPPPNTDETESPSTELCDTKISSIFVDGTEQALKQLETQTKTLNSIYIQDDDNDCSIFKRLTRKCTCLNRTDYNDLMIHFNEDHKYVTTPIGEVIKNIRILKKFLYMGGTYTKNALLFLNEAFEKSAHAEKVEITLACSHADLCNVFENQTIVTVCISWPQKYPNFAENLTQYLAASFLHKFVKLEEGRRYLKYTTKIINDIKRVIKKGSSKIDEDVITTLKAALNLIVPQAPRNVSLVYYSRHNDEGKVIDSINGLHQFRQYMTLEEVNMSLDLLNHFSHPGTGKIDLSTYLPDLLILFKQMLKEYDNSEINIMITNILNNIVSNSKNNIKKEKEPDVSLPLIVADTATEPIEMISEMTQMPQFVNNAKKPFNKFRQVSKFRQASRRRVPELPEPEQVLNLNRSKKFVGGIIVVPVEKKTPLK